MDVLIFCSINRIKSAIAPSLQEQTVVSVTAITSLGAPLTAACGASNGIANYFGIICLALIPNAIYYPIKSAGELILTSMISIIIFKEKLRPVQYVGVALGVLALVFINL